MSDTARMAVLNPDDRLGIVGVVAISRHPGSKPPRPAEVIELEVLPVADRYRAVRDWVLDFEAKSELAGFRPLYVVNLAPLLHGQPLYEVLLKRPERHPWLSLHGRVTGYRCSDTDRTTPNLRSVSWLPRECADIELSRALFAGQFKVRRDLALAGELATAIKRLSTKPRDPEDRDRADVLATGAGMAAYFHSRYTRVYSNPGRVISINYV